MDSGDVRRIVVFLLMLLRREWNVYAKTLNNSYLHNSPLPNLPMAEFLQVTLICSNDSTIHMIRRQYNLWNTSYVPPCRILRWHPTGGDSPYKSDPKWKGYLRSDRMFDSEALACANRECHIPSHREIASTAIISRK